VALREIVQLDFALPHRAYLRLASIDLVPAIASLVNRLQPWLFHIGLISFGEGNCKVSNHRQLRAAV